MATIGGRPIAPTEAAAETGDRLRPLPKGERADRQVGEGILAVEGYNLVSADLNIPQSRYARQPPLGKGALLSANQRPLQTPICFLQSLVFAFIQLQNHRTVKFILCIVAVIANRHCIG